MIDDVDVVVQLVASVPRRSSLLVDKYVCHNAVLEIVCTDHHIIVFDAARYGRNNSQVSDDKTPTTMFVRDCENTLSDIKSPYAFETNPFRLV